MVAYIPPETVTQWLGGDSWWTISVSLAVRILAYLNGYAVIPLVAGLIEK